AAAQVPVSGSRWFPATPGTAAHRSTEPAHFILTGTVPALLQISAADGSAINSPLLQALQIHGLVQTESQTVLVDFKSAHRSDLNPRTRQTAANGADADQWRALVLAWLLSQHAAIPTAAMVVY
ncbi:MAG: hypothetical protein ACKPHU_00420, partial [Planctomycetaceae bacterium]